VTTAGAWETAGMAHGAIRPVIGAVDAPFLQRMLLGLMDLAPGSWLLAEVSADRRCAACVDRATKRLTPLGTAGVSLVRDRAQALITLAHTGLGGPSSPALLPLGHDLAKGYALGLFGRLRHAKRPLDHAKQRLEKWQQNSQAERGAIEPAQALGAAWAPSVHPWRLADSRRQTSQEVAEQGRAALEAMATWLAPKGLPMPKAIVAKVRTHLTGIAALVDWWGPTVRHALTHLAMTPRWTQGAAAGLLPLLSWQEPLRRTRCPGHKAPRALALQAGVEAFEPPPGTRQRQPEGLAAWKAGAADHAQAFQRASAAGRNGSRAQMQPNHRGLPMRRYQVWTVRHHVDCRVAEGTPPASRFFRRSFPALCERVGIVKLLTLLPDP
jgi:Family of unknown function (DUF6399)